jgi:glycosyltransferase involved in cell wall biosynthesis
VALWDIEVGVKRQARKPAGVPARLVFLLEDLEYGGTQRQALELARRLDRSRFQVELWVLRAGDDLAPVAQEWDLPVVWMARSGWVGPQSLLGLGKRLWRNPPDLLMLLTVIPNIWGRLWGKLARAPLVVGNCRGGAAPWRQHERWLWPCADHILCNSSNLKEFLVSRYGLPPARLTVVPNGVDTEFFQPNPNGRPQGPPVLLSVARLVPDKDHDTLLRAFGQLSHHHPDAELWLVGNGPRRQILGQKVLDLGLPGRVKFLPGEQDLRHLYHQADLFVLSSVAEALPNVVLEAMAAGLPVVATRVGGVPEAVVPEATGLLVAPRDVAGLAGALGRLLDDPEARQTMGQQGRQRVLENFSFPAMVRRHEDVWARLLWGHDPI